MTPRVSIGMPVYNGERFLRQAIDSVLGQTYGDFELLISDNASTDGTEGICRAAAQRDARVRYDRRPVNVGAAPNYNGLVAVARGEFFKWAAHDDVLAPTFLERCVGLLDADPAAVLAFPKTRNIDADGTTLENLDDPPPAGGPSSRFAALLDGDGTYRVRMVSTVLGVIRMPVLRRTSLIGTYPSSDQVLVAELALLGRFAQVPEHLFMRRWHGANSWAASKTPNEIARWFDSRRGESYPMPRTAMLIGFGRAVRRAPLSAGERLRCAQELAGWVARRGMWRTIGGEMKIALRERVDFHRRLGEASRDPLSGSSSLRLASGAALRAARGRRLEDHERRPGSDDRSSPRPVRLRHSA
jgi:glycosyltransferase involved in cell wall biosynthesis